MQRTRFFPMILAALAMGSSSCVFRSGGSGSYGDVTMLWSFGTQQLGCSLVPEVTQVTIQIPGEQLQSGGTYDCRNAGTAGITLLDFAPGTYSFTIQGRNSAGSILYESSGTFRVDGPVTVTTTLMPSSTARGDAYLTWTFPGGRWCSSDPAVTQVAVSIDQGTPFDIPCAEGQSANGALVTSLSAGTHRIDLSAHEPTGFVYYSLSSSLTVIPGTGTSQQYDLDWAVGGLPIRWSFTDGHFQLTCAQAGVTDVYVNLIDPTNHYIYDGAGQKVSCSSGGFQGTYYFSYLYPATYQVFFQARGTGDVLYQTSQRPYPAIAVTRGVFPPLDSSTPVVVMSL